MNEQPEWLGRAKETYRFHRSHMLSTDDWNITKTSKTLRRSLGSICEDLKIAKWSKTHEKQLEKFTYAYEALAFIRKKQKEMDVAEIE